jgi:SOS-response transcriptional repressor LexA/DNA-binding XRE family transcriptional regulator
LNISEKLIELRTSSGKSQSDFAKLAGVSQRTWSSYESGQTVPKMGVLWALAANGYPIKGITTSTTEDWTEDQKKEYRRRMEILKTGVFPPEMPMDDFARILKAVDDNPPPSRDNSVLISGLEKVIKNSQSIRGLESRISAIEKKLETTSKSDVEYPVETEGMDSFTTDPNHKHLDYQYVADHETEYVASAGTIFFFDDIAAGPPTWQFTDSGRVVDVPMRLIKTQLSDYYALRVSGNSMIDALIPDGSMILIKKSDVPRHGAIQVVRLDDRVTLKRMREEEDHSWTLCYEDGTGRTIPLAEDNQVQGDFAAVLPPNIRPRMRGE